MSAATIVTTKEAKDAHSTSPFLLLARYFIMHRYLRVFLLSLIGAGFDHAGVHTSHAVKDQNDEHLIDNEPCPERSEQARHRRYAECGVQGVVTRTRHSVQENVSRDFTCIEYKYICIGGRADKKLYDCKYGCTQCAKSP